MRKTVLATTVFFLTVTAAAQDEEEYTVLETWRCYESADYSIRKILVKLTKRKYNENGFIVGTVQVAGVDYRSTFAVNGFDRRWTFGDDGDYSFIIKPNGDGLYYDFSSVEAGETTKANQIFICKMS